jgi:hypothetical protein
LAVDDDPRIDADEPRPLPDVGVAAEVDDEAGGWLASQDDVKGDGGPLSAALTLATTLRAARQVPEACG